MVKVEFNHQSILLIEVFYLVNGAGLFSITKGCCSGDNRIVYRGPKTNVAITVLMVSTTN